MFRRALANRYNAAAWHETISGNTILLVREVLVAAQPGEPDRGAILRLELDTHGNVLNETLVWQTEADDQHLEDTRALVLPDGRVLLGMTAVLKEEGRYIPYPAVMTLDHASASVPLTGVQVLRQFGPGKNMTPIDETTFLFRRDGSADHHRLLVIDWQDGQSQEVTTIDFPTDIPWAKWRIGTTMPPLWQTPTEALLLIHGITITDGRYIYSLGKAKLSRQGNRYAIEVDPAPLITPDDFRASDDQPLISELHAERRVVYACGGVQKEVDGSLVLALFVNVGDRQTVEVHLPMAELLLPWWQPAHSVVDRRHPSRVTPGSYRISGG